MNSLKRTFCMALCCTLLLGITAGTTSAAERAEGDTISHQTAVETVTSLGIMSVGEDGSFDPGGISQAQAKPESFRPMPL